MFESVVTENASDIDKNNQELIDIYNDFGIDINLASINGDKLCHNVDSGNLYNQLSFELCTYNKNKTYDVYLEISPDNLNLSKKLLVKKVKKNEKI